MQRSIAYILHTKYLLVPLVDSNLIVERLDIKPCVDLTDPFCPKSLVRINLPLISSCLGSRGGLGKMRLPSDNIMRTSKREDDMHGQETGNRGMSRPAYSEASTNDPGGSLAA